MITLKRVLLPTDFSSCSSKALTYAAALAQQFGAELHLLSVVESAAMVVPEPGFALLGPGESIQELMAQSERSLAELKLPAALTVPVVRAVRTGSPAAGVLEYAKAAAIDLIVLGTHGRTGLMHVLLGSVAEQIVRKSPCPVLSVRPDAHGVVPDA